MAGVAAPSTKTVDADPREYSTGASAVTSTGHPLHREPLRPAMWSVIVGLVFIAVFMAVSWFASPKGENQTVWRSSLMLSAFFCYLMWRKSLPIFIQLITFLAQWHPLIVPERSDLRPEFWKVEPQKG
ncbi:hypothetical protein CAC42_1676 [Sphaceloma murrayae]|uniref:Uncharacterized protein n=1 Tax=Sphaceloma murrayae TaxID=2082308 RepID=A0A2K1QHM2_9PEZI|nr:hypothetical protein CAC42_1676 [Sphaceloma murrayae]